MSNFNITEKMTENLSLTKLRHQAQEDIRKSRIAVKAVVENNSGLKTARPLNKTTKGCVFKIAGRLNENGYYVKVSYDRVEKQYICGHIVPNENRAEIVRVYADTIVNPY